MVEAATFVLTLTVTGWLEIVPSFTISCAMCLPRHPRVKVGFTTSAILSAALLPGARVVSAKLRTCIKSGVGIYVRRLRPVQLYSGR